MSDPIRAKHHLKHATRVREIKGTPKQGQKVSKIATGISIRSEDQPIDAIVRSFRRFLHIQNPDVLYALFGAVAGNCIEDTEDPVWLMLVGPSGSGKTTFLKSLLGIDKTRLVGSIDNKAALLSGTKKKERAKDSTGGVLNDIGDKGCLVWLEFTNVIELPRDQLKDVLTVLRNVYDGHWVRDIGGEGGTKLVWNGCVGAFGGVTNAIDMAHEFQSKMGERFLYYRMPDTDGWSEAYKALSAADEMAEGQDERVNMTHELQTVVRSTCELLDLTWRDVKPRVLTNTEKVKLIALGDIGTKARSGVERDFRTKEITAVPKSEKPMRFSKVLRKIYLGMEMFGVDEESRWRVLQSIVFDSMPLARKTALEFILETTKKDKDGASRQQIEKVMLCSESTVRRTLEELVLHGVLAHDADYIYFRPSKWLQERLNTIRSKV